MRTHPFEHRRTDPLDVEQGVDRLEGALALARVEDRRGPRVTHPGQQLQLFGARRVALRDLNSQTRRQPPFSSASWSAYMVTLAPIQRNGSGGM